MSLSINIRHYQPQDKLALSQLFLQTRIESWSWLDASQWTLQDFEASTQDELILVAEYGQQYLGFAAVFLPDNFLHHLFVAPQFQNLGVGSALLIAAEKHFTTTGNLKCLSENHAAQRFYIKHAWQVVDSGKCAEGDYVLMAKG
ncbi:GNAT family N-acetyltransferase [Acinetobacter rudis]|uniref:GNAT family N-acetyltransferase n=1 Tax=Acinetobacter rudis TaxID=632955 RepID=A0AAW8JC61_9GAMM|nr:GNAT family N-acetyltransferase [Acinetobacter rudis]MDQ8937087.1 GNAT family N-acetyltransferase [Acinetobacter rudis]MDQ9019305.1 GNAT family N-acetyltransferase [Acinetobacter rudis]